MALKSRSFKLHVIEQELLHVLYLLSLLIVRLYHAEQGNLFMQKNKSAILLLLGTVIKV